MKAKTPLMKALLLIGMGLMIPCYLLTVLNVSFAPWDLYERNRPLLIALTLAALALLLLAMRGIDRHEAFFIRHEKKLLLIAALFYFAVQMTMGALLRYMPNTDAEQCYTAAQLLVDTGTFGDNERSWEYFTRCTNNLGVVYILAAIFRFFGLFGWGDRFMQIVLVMSLLFTLGLLAGARVCRRIGGARAQGRMLLLFASCLPLLYCTTELYTDAYALAFPTMAIYCAMRAQEEKDRARQILFYALFALCTALGAQMRFTAIIPSIACLIWLLFTKRFARTLVAALLMGVCLLAGQGMVNRETAKHLDPADTEARAHPILHYLVMGLPVQQDEGYGGYGYGGWYLFTTGFDDPAERDAALLQEFIDRVYYLRYPNRLLHMMSRKNYATFGSGAFGLNTIIEADKPEADNAVKQVIFRDGALYPAYEYLCTALFLAHMILACLACAQQIRRRRTQSAPLMLALVGAFIILSIWETNARYFFQFEMVLLCAAALFEAPKKLKKT